MTAFWWHPLSLLLVYVLQQPSGKENGSSMAKPKSLLQRLSTAAKSVGLHSEFRNLMPFPCASKNENISALKELNKVVAFITLIIRSLLCIVFKCHCS